MNGKSELPEGWIEITLLDLAGGKTESIVGGPFGSNLQVKDYQNQGIPIIRLQNIDYFRFIPKDIKYISVEKATELKYHSFQKGDLVLAKLGSPIGKTSQIPENLEWGIVTADVVRIRIECDNIDKKYLLYYLNSPRSIAQLNNKIFGSTRPRVNLKEVRETLITLPPLAEQHRIVAAVEALLARVNASRERLDRVPRLLKAFRQAVLAAACSGRLTEGWRGEYPDVLNASYEVEIILKKREDFWEERERGKVQYKIGKTDEQSIKKKKYKQPFNPKFFHKLPNTWSEVTISQLCFLDVGYAFKSKDFCSEGIRLLRGENIEPGTLRWHETKYWNPKNLKEFEDLLVEEGEIILGMDRPIISGGLKIATVKKEDLPALLVQRVMRFKMINPICTQIVLYNLLKRDFIDYLKQGLTGSDLPHITGTNSAEYCIGFPPLPEQHEIVRRVESLFALADRIEQRVVAGRERADRLTQAILAKAFRGELVPTEAELARMEGRSYEPASVLLERIRRERESQGEMKPRKRKIRSEKGGE